MSNVYFTDMRTRPGRSLTDKVELLMRKAGIDSIDFKNKFTAIKIHLGEPGNLAYLRPNYAARVVEVLLKKGAKPFLTDANTLYQGRRANGLDHLLAAFENGYNAVTFPQCPVVIADGVRSLDEREIPIDQTYCKTAKIGSAIADADVIVSMNHFKGHEQAGFGGALKNLGMGSASRRGKLELHSSSQPQIDQTLCTACGMCVKYCASDAVHLNANKKAEIDYAKCVGCGQCVALCQFEAAQPVWNDSGEVLNYKISEYALAVIKDKPNFHINFIVDVSPQCDCWVCNDAAIVPNIGIAASFDPVALDQACADMVVHAAANPHTCLNTHEYGELQGEDKFKLIHPHTDWKIGLAYAEKIGLGSRTYELKTV
ncbi:MAG: DUF362 domain-containing protein [Prevotellaceae bacterium]|nr:DUF362 domain-containing protein [Prevotellaceae bacterium]